MYCKLKIIIYSKWGFKGGGGRLPPLRYGKKFFRSRAGSRPHSFTGGRLVIFTFERRSSAPIIFLFARYLMVGVRMAVIHENGQFRYSIKYES
jgi:hypothetical protein